MLSTSKSTINFPTFDDLNSFDVLKTKNTDNEFSIVSDINNVDHHLLSKHKKTSQPIPKSKEQDKKQVSKRSQVKNACVNCQKACKKCDDGRACQRCVKFGIADTCVDSPRKQRKKGFKRGPYRKREKQSTEPEAVVLNSYSTIKSSKDTSSLITSNMDSQNLAFCMQPADLTDIEMTRLWETNNASNSFQIKDLDDKNDFNFTVPGTNASIVNTPSYYQEPSYLVENTNTMSSSSSPKTLNYANTTHQNAAPHINSNDFLPLYDNALFALPKTENNVFISVTHSSPYDLNGIHDAFHYSELGFDMTHGSDVHLSNHTNQWIKSSILDNQDYITGI
ncbi:unnamed protein product [Rhizopus stolonifer]